MKPGVLLLAALLAACSTIETRNRDWSHYDGPGAAEFRAEEPPPPPRLADPLQPLISNAATAKPRTAIPRVRIRSSSAEWGGG